MLVYQRVIVSIASWKKSWPILDQGPRSSSHFIGGPAGLPFFRVKSKKDDETTVFGLLYGILIYMTLL